MDEWSVPCSTFASTVWIRLKLLYLNTGSKDVTADLVSTVLEIMIAEAGMVMVMFVHGRIIKYDQQPLLLARLGKHFLGLLPVGLLALL
jgi:hypothetical protein